MDRKLHADTLVLITMLQIYVFWYSGQTDGWTDRQTETLIQCGLPSLRSSRYTHCAWARETFSLCLRKVIVLQPIHALWVYGSSARTRKQ
jgi:hypothetical protein